MGSIFGGAIDRGKSLKITLADDTLCLLRANNPFPIDRTNLIALHPFYQALIIMIVDRATMFFVHCKLPLLSGKDKKLYLRLFHGIIATLN
ncbi:hypothetical protein MXB_5339 [Myxobolus squamalis]|nr:hypothetical protein MXB_5339 [Myxobolus squamalis]